MNPNPVLTTLTLIALVLLTGCGTVSAAESEPYGTITVGSASEVHPGETVTLDVTISNVTNFGAYQVYVDNRSIGEKADISMNTTGLEDHGFSSIFTGIGNGQQNPLYDTLPTANWYITTENEAIHGTDIVMIRIDITPKTTGETFTIPLIFEAFGTYYGEEMKQHYILVPGTVTTAGTGSPSSAGDSSSPLTENTIRPTTGTVSPTTVHTSAVTPTGTQSVQTTTPPVSTAATAAATTATAATQAQATTISILAGLGTAFMVFRERTL